MKAQLVKWGNSHAVRISKAIIKEAGLREGQDLEIRVTKPGRIAIETAKARLTLADLISRITSENRHNETDWGFRVGNELL
jgi:antitoxin MazE